MFGWVPGQYSDQFKQSKCDREFNKVMDDTIVYVFKMWLFSSTINIYGTFSEIGARFLLFGVCDFIDLSQGYFIAIWKLTGLF